MSERVRPRGTPLPEWRDDAVPITPQDIIDAIEQWDEDVPEAAGLLIAIPETRENVPISR